MRMHHAVPDVATLHFGWPSCKLIVLNICLRVKNSHRPISRWPYIVIVLIMNSPVLFVCFHLTCLKWLYKALIIYCPWVFIYFLIYSYFCCLTALSVSQTLRRRMVKNWRMRHRNGCGTKRPCFHLIIYLHFPRATENSWNISVNIIGLRTSTEKFDDCLL
jgi:hypothetical protein